MTLRSLLSALLAFASMAAAQQVARAGPLRAGPGPDATPPVDSANEVQEIMASYGRNPNTTSSVSFTRTFNNTPEDWTWRINVTDFAIPNNGSIYLADDNADYSQGLRIVNTQWDLSWPGQREGETFLDSMKRRGWESVSFNALVTNKPANVTKNYQDRDNGDCTPVLGAQCAASLVRAASEINSNTLSILYAGLEGCEDTLNAVTAPSIRSGEARGWALRPVFNQTYKPGETLFYSSSNSFPAGDDYQITLAEGALQVFVMMPVYGSGAQRNSDGPTVLCRVVNKAAAQKEPWNNAASSIWDSSMASIWGAIVLSTLAAVWL